MVSRSTAGRHRAAPAIHRPALWIAAAVTLCLALLTTVSVEEVDRGSRELASDRAGRVSASPPAVPSTNPPSPPAPKPPRRFTIAASGDILVHTSVWERARGYGAESGLAFDFRPMFARVRPVLSAADLALCHLETPLSGDDRDLSSFPVFSVPREVAEAIAYAGFDSCSTASNHSLDGGTEGIEATLDALDAVGVRHAGTARDAAEARRPTILWVHGVRVAHLSYAYGFNGFVVPEEEPWAANQIDPARILSDARAARKRGADFVVVSLHWGTEFRAEPTEQQLEVARAVLSSPAVDLVLGHHAHIVQPIGRIHGKYVVYGLGNFLSNMTTSIGPPGVSDGVIVHVLVEERGKRFVVSRVTYTPTWVEQGTTWRILPVAAALDARSTADATRSLLEASWDRTTQAIEALGADRFGVTPKRLPRGQAET
jgi:poly-gamma-glutamate synthesis protein (capsule biosynthesis protein)